MSQSQITVADKIDLIAAQLLASDLYYGHGFASADDEAAYIVAHIIHNLVYDDAFYSTKLNAEQLNQIDTLVQQRITTKKPLAYLTGEGWFAGYPFLVSEDVLVPRSPIAELILDGFAPWVEPENATHILDLCTGSGCIGIACALQFADANVTLTDIDAKALSVAQQNIARYALQSRVSVIESDVFAAVPPQKYDIIVSNPPYVDAQDMASLPQEYRHEPEHGLAAGQDGLDIVEQILQTAARYLSDSGILIVEVGNSEQALVQKYPDAPFVWLDFEYGGHGVFLLEAASLKQFNATQHHN